MLGGCLAGVGVLDLVVAKRIGSVDLTDLRASFLRALRTCLACLVSPSLTLPISSSRLRISVARLCRRVRACR